ncbi:TIGR03960 family B12-binding radical SAM protein [Chloroflexota bacterium]
MLDNNALLKVTKPARYTGGEWNSIQKDWQQIKIKVALSYPDIYEIGMSNMAVPILYELLNRQPDVLAERVFAPWVDMEALLRARKIPLFSLETKHPLKDFDIIGFSLGYELTYTNVLNMLDLAGIPLLRTERDDSNPLIIAGGSCCLNPEPMSDFIDAFVIGDGEEVTLELLDVFRNWQNSSLKNTKTELLQQLSQVSGIYVPSLYRVEYEADGRIKSFTPNAPGVSPRITHRIVAKLPPPVTNPVLPYLETIHDRGAIEIQRGCTCGCRFCQAGMIYRPLRERPHDEVIEAAKEIIQNCGYDEISLVSLNTSDYHGIEDLITNLSSQFPQLSLSVPSLRFDSSAIKLLSSLPGRSKPGLTFAPEAGSERLRKVINKNITEESILETATAALAKGWNSLKLYFMVGLPTETMEDVAGIGELVEKIRIAGRQGSNRTPQLRISVATFVPKAHSPFQWVAQEIEPELNKKHELLRQTLPRKGVKLSWHDPKISLLEAVISRGDRKLGEVIYHAWKLGAKLDAWTECFNYEKNWLPAFTNADIEPAFYANRERSLEETLPWFHIDIGVTQDFLKSEYRRALEATVTQDCRYHVCNACGFQHSTSECRAKIS